MKFARSFRTHSSENFGLSLPSLGLVLESSSEVSQFLASGFRANVETVKPMMAVSKVFGWSNPFKVIGSVIRFVFVNVVDLLFTLWVRNPAGSNDSMHEPLAAKRKVSITTPSRRVWREVSKNFPTARHCVEVVKKSIFDAVHFDANHAASLLGIEAKSYH